MKVGVGGRLDTNGMKKDANERRSSLNRKECSRKVKECVGATNNNNLRNLQMECIL